MTNDEFEHQQRAYNNYVKFFTPELQWTNTIYKDLYSGLTDSLVLTEVSLGDCFFEQYVNDINKNLNRIENEVTIYAQNNNYDKTQKEQLFYHKPFLENRIKELIQEYSSKKVSINKGKSKNILDENDLKFQVCLYFANGKIYELHSIGFSHPKKAEQLFINHDKTKSIIGYIKNTYNNISKDKDIHNKNKNLFNNIELIAFVKNHCIENRIDINSTFLKECNKNNPKESD